MNEPTQRIIVEKEGGGRTLVYALVGAVLGIGLTLVAHRMWFAGRGLDADLVLTQRGGVVLLRESLALQGEGAEAAVLDPLRTAWAMMRDKVETNAPPVLECVLFRESNGNTWTFALPDYRVLQDPAVPNLFRVQKKVDVRGRWADVRVLSREELAEDSFVGYAAERYREEMLRHWRDLQSF